MALTRRGDLVEFRAGLWMVERTGQLVTDYGDGFGHVDETGELVYGLAVVVEPEPEPEPEVEAVPAGVPWGFATPMYPHRIRRGHARIRVGVHARGRAILRRDATPQGRVRVPAITVRARVELQSVVLAARQDDEELLELGIL
jgi:hypothetical protein